MLKYKKGLDENVFVEGHMKSKEDIVETYKKMIIDKKSSRITVKELCNHMKISRPTFYKHFRDTYDILEYILINDGIYQTRVLVDQKIDKLTITEAWYLSFYKNKDFYFYAIQDESQNSMFNTLITSISKLNRDYFIQSMTKQDAEYYAYKYASSQAMLLKKWILEGMTIDPKKMAEYFMKDILN